MELFFELVTLSTNNPDVTFNLIVSVVFFLGLVDTVHECSYYDAPVKRRVPTQYKIKAVGFFILMYIGNTFRYSAIAITVVAVISTICLLKA